MSYCLFALRMSSGLTEVASVLAIRAMLRHKAKLRLLKCSALHTWRAANWSVGQHWRSIYYKYV